MDERRALTWRTAAVCAAVLVVSLVAALLLFAPHRSAQVAQDASAGCRQHALRFTVTDDAAEYARQKRYEASIDDPNATPLPKPGMYRTTPPATPTLHAASHGYVVVFYRAGIGAPALRELSALNASATQVQAPVLISPHPQRAPLVAVALGQELTCAAAGAAQARAVRAFSASVYPSVAG